MLICSAQYIGSVSSVILALAPPDRLVSCQLRFFFFFGEPLPIRDLLPVLGTTPWVGRVSDAVLLS